ncbi:hypothetical protein G6F24_017269 [Rhizopus arrhizus]|nr:hypothetical protein G6F24_017269 [Rhizopus arrhizus]
MPPSPGLRCRSVPSGRPDEQRWHCSIAASPQQNPAGSAPRCAAGRREGVRGRPQSQQSRRCPPRAGRSPALAPRSPAAGVHGLRHRDGR